MNDIKYKLIKSYDGFWYIINNKKPKINNHFIGYEYGSIGFSGKGWYYGGIITNDSKGKFRIIVKDTYEIIASTKQLLGLPIINTVSELPDNIYNITNLKYVNATYKHNNCGNCNGGLITFGSYECNFCKGYGSIMEELSPYQITFDVIPNMFLFNKQIVTLKEATDTVNEYLNEDDFIQAHYAMRFNSEYGMDDNSIDLHYYYNECKKLVNINQ